MVEGNELRAIDLYSGIGGWSVGLRCAGIEVVEAYEIWPTAVRTYNSNLNTSHPTTDVRALDLADLPKDISLVVGSPPCTEFSFANRGGAGDISEGLKDIVKFFKIVQHLAPRYWIMENVPRTEAVIRLGLRTKEHVLYEFRELQPDIRVMNLAELGLPQSRSRCFVGRFPFDRLEAYGRMLPRRNLHTVLKALSSDDIVRDPLWGVELPKSQLTEMEPEPALNQEQLRMNREAKRFHPVYNDMPFPDPLDEPSRTVTATCTRVSRESIVISDTTTGSVRRLTVRERASLQGFPITYQFYGNSHSQKVKMIGNAVPPFFAYLAGAAARHRDVAGMDDLDDAASGFTVPEVLPAITPPHEVGISYPTARRFRAALPGLRFKSGMRFQLSNHHRGDKVSWAVEFFFGPSKDIRTVALDGTLYRTLMRNPTISGSLKLSRTQLAAVRSLITMQSEWSMQAAWRQSANGAGPYQLADLLGQAAISITSALTLAPSDELRRLVRDCCKSVDGVVVSEEKLARNAAAVLAGLVLGSWFNDQPWGHDPAMIENGRRFRDGHEAAARVRYPN